MHMKPQDIVLSNTHGARLACPSLVFVCCCTVQHHASLARFRRILITPKGCPALGRTRSNLQILHAETVKAENEYHRLNAHEQPWPHHAETVQGKKGSCPQTTAHWATPVGVCARMSECAHVSVQYTCDCMHAFFCANARNALCQKLHPQNTR